MTCYNLEYRVGNQMRFRHVSFNDDVSEEEALVFRLKTRLAEGTVLTADELSGLDYDLAILTRVA